jgi:MFS family permease
VGCGTFIFVLDFFVVNVALPDIQRSLGASEAAIEWLVSGYALTSAALLVTGGRLGDHYGRRRWFSIGLGAFVLASALCALAPDPAVLLAVFAGHLRRATARGRRPLLDPGIFAVPAFRAGLTVQVLFWCQQAASYLLLALFLQQGRGLSPLESGGVFSVLAAGYLATSFRAPGLTLRFGRRVIATGALIGAAGNLLLLLAVARWGVGGPLAALFPGLFLLGAGQGLCITPLTTTVLAHADARTAGSVSGALSTAQQVGNAIGVAVSGVIFYGLLGHGYRAAFGSSIAQMGCLLLAVAALTLTLLRPAAANREG